MADRQCCGWEGRHSGDDGRVRRRAPRAIADAGPLDYDDQLVPGEIGEGIIHLSNVTDREELDLGFALRWSYGSVFGIWHGLLRRRIPEPWASAAFGATLMTATLTLFPLLGRTPPPWRWPPAVIATAFGTHAVYVGTVAAVDLLVQSRLSVNGTLGRRGAHRPSRPRACGRPG